LRTVHIVLALDVGGLERVVLDLVSQARELGQSPAIICLERPGALAAQAAAAGVPLVCLAKAPGVQSDTVRRLRSALRQLRPAVVHTHQLGALFYAGLAACGTGLPVLVHTEHGRNFTAGLRRRLLGRIAAHYAARFFCVSSDIAAHVVDRCIVPRRKTIVVPNGIETARFHAAAHRLPLRQALGIAPAAPVIGTVGRLTAVKRQDRLLSAFAQVLRHVPAAHLLLVGDGPLRDDLHAQAAALGIAARVHFAGYQAQPERYLAAMDVFALTSDSEGMPLAILEAWAAGLPVVAARVGGVPELVAPEETGLLCEPDDGATLARSLTDLLIHPAKADRLGTAGRRVVESYYTLRRMAEVYQSHYATLLAGTAARPAQRRTAECAS